MSNSEPLWMQVAAALRASNPSNVKMDADLAHSCRIQWERDVNYISEVLLPERPDMFVVECYQ